MPLGLALGWLSVTSSTTHKQIWPFWCWFPGEWACVHSRALWVSPTNSAVRLGIFLTTAVPTGFYSQRFWGFISLCWNPGLQGVLLPRCSFWFICTPMWDHPVCQLPPCFMSFPLRLPISASPTSLEECFLFNSLVVELPYSLIFWQFWSFFVFKFVVFFDCARRQSASTYTSILAKSPYMELFWFQKRPLLLNSNQEKKFPRHSWNQSPCWAKKANGPQVDTE